MRLLKVVSTLLIINYHVRMDEDGGVQGQLLFLLDVVRHVAQLLFHHSHCLEIGSMVESVTPQQQQLQRDGKEPVSFHLRLEEDDKSRERKRISVRCCLQQDGSNTSHTEP